MAQYIIKNTSGTFEPGSQPDGFATIGALENRMFRVECPVIPNSEFVAEFPTHQQAQFLYYPYANGKKLPFDPFNGTVEFGSVVDSKGRREIVYTEAQQAERFAVMQWLMLNVWIPDKTRMYNIVQEIVDSYISQVNALPDADTAQTYLRKNLYYNL